MGCSCRTWGQVRPQHDFRDHFDDLCWNHSFLRGDNGADPASLGTAMRHARGRDGGLREELAARVV
jgi:hypothetical protein